jgi:chemotaxis methyl-accepting protein methylase
MSIDTLAHGKRLTTRRDAAVTHGIAGMTKTDGLQKAGDSPVTTGCRLVAIGSSAGGLTALRTLFEKLPPDLGVAFVVITHLNPDQPSALVPILAKHTRMPVSEVGRSVPIEPDHIYVIAPNRQLVVEDSMIGTEPFAEPRGLRAPIDWFFRSLAERHRDGFGIVLSGGGSDGTVGIRAMKGAGAVILVQDPKEAEFPWMPRNAIATGCADVVAPVAELAEKLVQLIRNQKSVNLKQTGIKANDTVRQILAYLHARTGQDFSNYKAAAILRRLTRRMQLNNFRRIEDYDVYLRNSPEEVQALFGDFLISVTHFFRDPETFKALCVQVIPELVSKSLNTPLRVWVPGCATGEDVYSLAIVLLEETARQGHRELQIFATDIDACALDKAREGVYPAVIENDVSEERLQRFFTREGHGYRINRAVRNAVVFAHHSLLADAPFSKVDLISCRNLLIHLDQDAQKRVLATLHYALNPGGYLFLGADETAETEPDFFRAVDREHRIYQALLRTAKPALEPSRLSLRAAAATMPRSQPFSHAALAVAQADVHLQALEQFAPPSVLVDTDHHMLHLSENAGRFMQHPSGPPSTNIIELVRPELKPELSRALHAAFERDESSLCMPVPVEFNHAMRRISLHVLPVKAEGVVSRALVLFLDGGPFEHTRHVLPVQASHDEARAIISRLSEEVDFTQQQLRESRAEYATANEELRTSNEELLSANEEYRATAEELEASKEELQSMNEELLTLNAELKAKIDYIALANTNLQNLMAAMEGGTLFIDADMCITFFTPGVVRQFNIVDSDIGRPITDFTHRLKYTELAADARAVLRNLTPVQRDIESTFDEWFLMRMRPYRNEGRIEGVAITFIDVTLLHRAEEALKESEARYRALVTTSSSAIFRMSRDWQEMRELDGHGFVEDTARPSTNWLDTYVDPSDQPQVKAAVEKAVQGKSTFVLEHRIKLADGKLGWAFSRAVPRLDANGEIIEWFGAISDLTEYHRVQDELAQSRRIEAVGRV